MTWQAVVVMGTKMFCLASRSYSNSRVEVDSGGERFDI